MPLVAVSSPKGGVGKTTVVANLAAALAEIGYRVVTVDFDVQNSLRLHFGMAIEDGRGYAAAAVASQDWSRLLLKAANGVFFLPYGHVDHGQRSRLMDAIMIEGGRFIADHLQSILSRSDCIVLADTPPGPGPILDALDEIADFRVVVLLTDAVSLSQLPVIENGQFFADFKGRSKPLRLVLNQVDLRRQLSRDITSYLRTHTGKALLGTIRQDEAMAEAVANQQTILEYAPQSGAVVDVKRLAYQLEDSIFFSKHKPSAGRP